MKTDRDLQPALSAAQNQIGLIFSTSDSLDGKALAILGFDVAIGIFGVQANLDNSLWLLVPIFGLLIISLLISIFTILPRDYMGAVVNLDDHPEYFEFSSEELVIQLLANSQEAIAHNSLLNVRKTRYCLAAILTGLLATAGIIGCIIQV